MPTHTVFYSWQSDLPNSINRGFIEDCLERIFKQLKSDEELQLDPCLDRDTSGVPGSPDIAATIFDKIKAADIFVGDVTFIDKGEGDAQGHIHAIQHDAGFVVMAGGAVTFDSPDRRTQARYRNAIAKLMESGYLDHVSEELYEVSAEGYQFADNLPSDDGH